MLDIYLIDTDELCSRSEELGLEPPHREPDLQVDIKTFDELWRAGLKETFEQAGFSYFNDFIIDQNGLRLMVASLRAIDTSMLS